MLLTFPILCFPQVLSASEGNRLRNDEVIVQFEDSLRSVADEVLRIFPAVKQDLEQKLKSEITFVPTIRLMRERKRFLEIANNSSVVAVAIARANLVIIDNSKMKTHPFSLEVTLKHELCHLFLHDYVGQNKLPRWLNEGISQWASDGITEILMGEDRDLLKKAILSGRYIPINRLMVQFPADERLLRLSYEESKSVVEYIINEFGIDGVISILNNMKAGDPAESAIEKGLSISLRELEAQWHSSLKKRITWFTYFSSRIYEIIFAMASLILTYGFIRFIIRKRAYKDEDDEETDDDVEQIR
jgi:hypothetical protein